MQQVELRADQFFTAMPAGKYRVQPAPAVRGEHHKVRGAGYGACSQEVGDRRI